mmetsp:Transcript_28523/g.59421  ORF Transcript_28523/g.59421 Transcript_28523/m.59421 type:complete len:101 (-) Transcript_28523:198-500(-)
MVIFHLGIGRHAQYYEAQDESVHNLGNYRLCHRRIGSHAYHDGRWADKSTYQRSYEATDDLSNPIRSHFSPSQFSTPEGHSERDRGVVVSSGNRSSGEDD